MARRLKWTLLRRPEQVARALYARGVPRDASRDRVLAELHLAGYWPTAEALDAYLGVSVAA
jgi:hypothetical protein